MNPLHLPTRDLTAEARAGRVILTAPGDETAYVITPHEARLHAAHITHVHATAPGKPDWFGDTILLLTTAIEADLQAGRTPPGRVTSLNLSPVPGVVGPSSRPQGPLGVLSGGQASTGESTPTTTPSGVPE